MNKNLLATWKEDDRPQRGCWAPGHYMRKCSSCGDGFVGDKRAVICADCAYKEEDHKEQPAKTAGKLDKFAPLLHKRWAAKDLSEYAGMITGNWAEDDSEFHIMLPKQLTQLLVELQNMLSEVYQNDQKV